MVAGAHAFEYTGRVSNAAWVAVPDEYAERISFGDGRLTKAAEGARSALDTATQMTTESQRARARLPLSMTGRDLDQAVRARVKALSASNKGRLDALTRQLERPGGARQARDGDAPSREGPPHQGPRAR